MTSGTPASLPALTYPDAARDATSGHSGSDTSERLAANADSSGETKGQQQIALRLAEHHGALGITWTELLDELRFSGYPRAHHGAASRTLSNLHRAGMLCRLELTRDDRKIYVLPQHVAGRPTELPRTQRGKLTQAERDALAEAQTRIAEADPALWLFVRPETLETLVAALERIGA